MGNFLSCNSLAISKLVTTKEGEMMWTTEAEVRIHDASQLLIANDEHLEIFPVKKMSISTNVVGSSHTRR